MTTLEKIKDKYKLSRVKFDAWKAAIAGAVSWRPAILLVAEDLDPGRLMEDDYEFYANPERTIWVSVNRKQNRFRLCYHEFLSACSEWEDVTSNVELQPIGGVA